MELWLVDGRGDGLNDTGLILEIVDRVVANHSVDEQIYLTGWSNCSQPEARQRPQRAVACMSYYPAGGPQP